MYIYIVVNKMEQQEQEQNKKVYVYKKLDYETRKKYNDEFMKNNKGRRSRCDLCNCEFSYFSACRHRKTEKHIRLTQILELKKQVELLSKPNTPNS